MNGAGGTSGGVGHFFLGLIMMCGGFYLLLNSISVSSSFGMGARLYGFSAYGFKFWHGGSFIRFFSLRKPVWRHQWHGYVSIYDWHRHYFL